MTTVCKGCQTPVDFLPEGATFNTHKCQLPVVTVEINCACGWQSAGWVGKGARKNAYAEWREHKRVATNCTNDHQTARR